MIAVLVIHACLITDPSKCHDFRTKSRDTSITQCYQDSPELFRLWTLKYPQYKFVSAKCISVDDDTSA